MLEKVPLDFAHYQKNLVDWCNHNTGSRNYSSVASFLPRLENAFAQLGGEIKHLPLEKERVVLANGEIKEIDLGHSLHVKMRPNAVSYTHLDVYKRQVEHRQKIRHFCFHYCQVHWPLESPLGDLQYILRDFGR